MKEYLTPRWLIIKLTGLLFAAYSAYNVFIIFRDKDRSLTSEGILISAIVALLFAILAAFAWTSEVKNFMFLKIRRKVLIITLLAIIALKLRIIDRVVANIDYTNMITVLYGASFIMTIVALVILFIYYAFIVKRIILYPRASIILPLSAMILFLLSLIAEAILFFEYGFGLEANPLRTVVIRPVFYLGFIGLSAYFLFPPQLTTDEMSMIAVSEIEVDDTFIM